MPYSLIVKVRLYLNDAHESIASPTGSANGNFRQGGSLEWNRMKLIKSPELYNKRPNRPQAEAGHSLWPENPAQSLSGTLRAAWGITAFLSALPEPSPACRAWVVSALWGLTEIKPLISTTPKQAFRFPQQHPWLSKSATVPSSHFPNPTLVNPPKPSWNLYWLALGQVNDSDCPGHSFNTKSCLTVKHGFFGHKGMDSNPTSATQDWWLHTKLSFIKSKGHISI